MSNVQTQAILEPNDLANLDRQLTDLHAAVGLWHSRQATPDRTYVSGGHAAVDAIDDLLRNLYALRTRLISELRIDEKERAARVDHLLAEYRAEVTG